MDRKALGNRVKTLRKAKGLNQKDLERVSGVSERTIQEIEAGKGNPAIGFIELIGEALGETLLAISPTPTKSEGIDLGAAIEILSRLSSLPAPYQRVILALLHKDAKLVRGLPETTHKAVLALISAL